MRSPSLIVIHATSSLNSIPVLLINLRVLKLLYVCPVSDSFSPTVAQGYSTGSTDMYDDIVRSKVGESERFGSTIVP